MFTVTFVHLAPDIRSANSEFAPMTFKDVSEAQIAAALQVFRQIDPVQNSEAEPHVIIESSVAKLLIRTGQGKLFAYNARNLAEPFSELEPNGILRQLSRHVGTRESTPLAAPAPEAAPVPAKRRRHHGLALTVIVLALALDGYSVFSFLRVRPVVPPPAVDPILDAQAIESARHAAAGRYTTGAEPGDRAIEITSDGYVRFLRLTSGGQRLVADEKFTIARHDGRTCLVTSTDRVIDVQNIYTISYSRDTYHRR